MIEYELHLGDYYHYIIDEEIYNKIIQTRSFGQIPIIYMKRSDEYYLMIGYYKGKNNSLYFSKIIDELNQFPILQNANTKVLSFEDDIKPYICKLNYKDYLLKNKEESNETVGENNTKSIYRIDCGSKGYLDIKKELYIKIKDIITTFKNSIYIEIGKEIYRRLKIVRSTKNINDNTIYFILYFEYNHDILLNHCKVFSFEEDIKPYVLFAEGHIKDIIFDNLFKELKLKEEELKSLYSILSYQKNMMEKCNISKIETIDGDNITYKEIDNLLEKVKNQLVKEDI